MRLQSAVAHLQPVTRRQSADLRITDADLTYPSRRAFLSNAKVGNESCQLFWPGAPSLPPHSPVVLRVSIPGIGQVHFIRGTLVRSQESHLAATAGAVVEIRGAAVLIFGRLYAQACGRDEHLGRRCSDRHAVRLSADWASEGAGPGPAVVRDLSREGAFLAIAGARPVRGSFVHLTARIGFLRRFSADARVAWVGTSCGEAGVGLQFCGLRSTDQLTLASFLGDLSKR